MNPILILAAVAAFAILTIARGARAATTTPPPADGGSGGGGSMGSDSWARMELAIPGPMPIGAMRQIRKTESGGRPGIVVADMVTGASELGGYQLVVEHDAAGNPDASSGGGAIGADVDPLDRWGAYYGAQWVYSRAKLRFTGDLESIGLPVPPDTDVGSWIIIMHAQHSIGRAGFVKLLREGKSAGKGTVAAILKYWAEEKMPPQINRQSPELVRKRVVRMRGLPAIAARNAPLPPKILGLVSRPSTVPRFDAAKAKRYILAERARGTKARQADGSPPGV